MQPNININLYSPRLQLVKTHTQNNIITYGYEKVPCYLHFQQLAISYNAFKTTTAKAHHNAGISILARNVGLIEKKSAGCWAAFVFIARDSIYAIVRICYRPSVRLSVRPSVTRVDQSKTVEVRIMQLPPPSSPMTLVSSRLISLRNSKGNIGSGDAK